MPRFSASSCEIVNDLVNRLDEPLRDLYEERAGIMQFDAGLSREHAECLALLNLYRDHPMEILGILVLHLTAEEYLLVHKATDLTARGLTGLRQGLVDQVFAKLGGVVRITAYK